MPEKLDLRREKIEIGLLAVAAIWLFCAIGSNWDYGFYTIMRLFVAYTAVQLAIWHRQLLLPLIAVAVLYQPIIKLHLGKDTWGTINVITAVGAVVMGGWLVKYKKYLSDIIKHRDQK